jgi:hypothetical protein
MPKTFLGGITTPLGGLTGAAPPSALNELNQLGILYAETGEERYLVAIRGVVRYVKAYQKITCGMNRTQRIRTVTNPKWTADVPYISLYGTFFFFRSCLLRLSIYLAPPISGGVGGRGDA